MKNMLAIIFVKAVIITTLINFYMVSILPDGSIIHEDDSNSISSSAAERYNNNPNASWVCVRKFHSATNADKTIHGRRLGMRVHRGFNKEKPEAMIHYESRHYEPKSHIARPHFKDGHYNPEETSEIRDHTKGALRRIHEQYDEKREIPFGDQCEMYSCINKDGTFVETNDSSGYAGKFVHRDRAVAKQVMRKPGGKTWASGCAVSHKYKFIYIHVLKSGGTATKEFIRKSLCGEDDKQCDRVDRHIIQPSSCRIAMQHYPDYFTFTFVRNPFSRMFSLYSMADGFPTTPSMRGHVTDTLSFKDFVRMTPKERKKYTKMHPSHYYSQTDFILSKSNCPAFDFLGRVEHFNEDMRTILEHLDAKEMIEYLNKNGGVQPANTWGSNKKETLGGDLNSVYSPEEVSSVTRIYREDFDLLGYDQNEIPSD